MKKIFSLLLCAVFLHLNLGTLVMAADQDATYEHLNLPKKLAKKTPVNLVKIDEVNTSILQYNTMQLVFAQDFTSKNAQIGDEIAFCLNEDLKTVEGTVILPEKSLVIAKISQYEKPKSFNRSGKIYLDFQYIQTPDGTKYPIQARIFNKNAFLSRGKLNAMGKGLSTTLGGAAIGIGAGCGIGAAAGAVIIGGFAIGLPIGIAVGGIAGLVTPGLLYKAKAGDKINIQIVQNIDIAK